MVFAGSEGAQTSHIVKLFSLAYYFRYFFSLMSSFVPNPPVLPSSSRASSAYLPKTMGALRYVTDCESKSY